MENNFDDLKDFIKRSYDSNKMKLVKRKKIIIITMNLLSIICLIIGGIGLKSIYDYRKDFSNTEDLQSSIKKYKPVVDNSKSLVNENITENDKDIANINYKSFQELLKINSDTVGWLKIKGTDIDMPIVKTVDNSYYLNHNFNKELSSLGWGFMDYRNSVTSLDKNTILYGHTYKNTLIFSSLSNVLKSNWLNNDSYHTIVFNTLYSVQNWQVFSVYTEEKNSYFTKMQFEDETFEQYLNNIKNKSIKDFGVELNDEDKIITISTCYIDTNHRLIVHAKLIK